MKYNYVGGVLPHEKHMIERFEEEILPYVTKYGPYIGQFAMEGNEVAKEIILRHNGFIHGGPSTREFNYRRLLKALKKWQRNWDEAKSQLHKLTGVTLH